jgi:hypothetical protein
VSIIALVRAFRLRPRQERETLCHFPFKHWLSFAPGPSVGVTLALILGTVLVLSAPLLGTLISAFTKSLYCLRLLKVNEPASSARYFSSNSN